MDKSLGELENELIAEFGVGIRNFDSYDWREVVERYELSEAFLRKYRDVVYWDALVALGNLSEDLARKFHQHINFSLLTIHQKLSEEFIEDFEYVMSWRLISKHQNLSEAFILKYKHRVNWRMVSRHQPLTFEFIWNNIDRLYAPYILKNEKVELTDLEREVIMDIYHLQDAFAQNKKEKA